MLAFPDISRLGAVSGLMLCGKVIIPTLFPFVFCVLFIMNCGVSNKFNFFDKSVSLLFGLNSTEFFIMLLSFIGGYPTGAKLLDNYAKESNSSRRSEYILCFCVNAGPAFIVMAVGEGILHSKILGYCLLIAHILSSLVLAVAFKFFLKNIKSQNEYTLKSYNTSDNIVISASASANATLSVCGYVILFSVINALVNKAAVKIPFFGYFLPLLEVTNAIAESNNVYHISFLLGFAGICVWFQVAGLVKNFKFNIYLFVISRFFQGILSIAFLKILIKIFSPTIPTYSNSVAFSGAVAYKNISLSFSLVMMIILLVLSIFSKKRVEKLI